MTLFIIFLIVFFISNLYENYFREKAIEYSFDQRLAKRFGKQWHRFQWAGWAAVVIYTVYNLFEIWFAIRITLFIGSCWWILFDGGLNSLKNRWFWYQSTQTTSEFEVFANPFTKLILFVITFLAIVLW